MTRFLLIRHALTDAAGKRLTGRLPGIHLNKDGVLQAEQLALRLAGLPVAAIYSSPLERAVETALPIAALLNITNTTCDDFIEIDFGEWENCSIEELKGQPQFERFNLFRSCTRAPGGELMAEAQLRMVKGLEKLCLQHKGQTVAIISHADVIKAAIAYYAGISIDMMQRVEVSPASISIIEVYDETVRLLVVNDTGKLHF